MSIDKLISKQSQPLEVDMHLHPLERTSHEDRLIAKSKIVLGKPESNTDPSIILGEEEVTADEYKRRSQEGTLVNSKGEVVSIQDSSRPLKGLNREKE